MKAAERQQANRHPVANGEFLGFLLRKLDLEPDQLLRVVNDVRRQVGR